VKLASDINFIRDGRVGDKVWHPVYGNGVISSKENNTIGFLFESQPYEYDMLMDLMCWGHREPLDQGKPPAREPEPLGFNGTPVWAWVGSDPREWRHKNRKQVVARAVGGIYAAISGGRSNLQSIETTWWDYAWEIPE